MIREIVKDTFFLSRKSVPAGPADARVIRDLQDTLQANRYRCVGMAANMIGYNKRIIVVGIGLMNVIMVNPKITSKSGPYETEEGCLSLSGKRKTKRYQKIEVEYQDASFRKHKRTFEGYTAQIIQHEADHLEGILI
ncbi:MAG: peptide deformylase [Solobacterium sp.]|nr:peptide deformylase [Solobacterium sp.]